MMHTAKDTQHATTYRFRKFDALVKRIAGKTSEYRVESSDVQDPQVRRVLIVRANRHVGGYDVLARLMVHTEALRS